MIYESENILGWMNTTELGVIDRLCQEINSAPSVGFGAHVLEIGCLVGRSSYRWARALAANRKSTLVCVDPWMGSLRDFPKDALAAIDGGKDFDLDEPIYDQFLKNTMCWTNLKAIRYYSMEYRHFEPLPKPDLIFLDGDHSKTGLTFDLHASLPGGQFGGQDHTIIAGHDYDHALIPHIKPIVDEFAVKNNYDLEVPAGTSIFIMRPK